MGICGGGNILWLFKVANVYLLFYLILSRASAVPASTPAGGCYYGRKLVSRLIRGFKGFISVYVALLLFLMVFILLMVFVTSL